MIFFFISRAMFEKQAEIKEVPIQQAVQVQFLTARIKNNF